MIFLDLDDTVKDKEAKAVEKAKKRALSSSILKELRDEYYEGPEEIKVFSLSCDILFEVNAM